MRGRAEARDVLRGERGDELGAAGALGVAREAARLWLNARPVSPAPGELRCARRLAGRCERHDLNVQPIPQCVK